MVGCPFCRETGTDPDTGEPCPLCLGHGVLVSDGQPCPACKGHGVRYNRACTSCEGTGRNLANGYYNVHLRSAFTYPLVSESCDGYISSSLRACYSSRHWAAVTRRFHAAGMSSAAISISAFVVNLPRPTLIVASASSRDRPIAVRT